VVNLKAQGDGGGMNIKDYIATHFIAGTEKVGIQLLIRAINNMSLNMFVLVLTWITDSASLHQEPRTLMLYSMDYLRPMVYDWSTSLLANMKS
jgi:hypothetical protein